MATPYRKPKKNATTTTGTSNKSKSSANNGGGGNFPNKAGAGKSATRSMGDKTIADKDVRVKQSTIDSMKEMGMTKAIAKANSGNASQEFIVGARRMYGNRINKSGGMKDARPLKDKSSPNQGKIAAYSKRNKGNMA